MFPINIVQYPGSLTLYLYSIFVSLYTAGTPWISPEFIYLCVYIPYLYTPLYEHAYSYMFIYLYVYMHTPLTLYIYEYINIPLNIIYWYVYMHILQSLYISMSIYISPYVYYLHIMYKHLTTVLLVQFHL